MTPKCIQCGSPQCQFCDEDKQGKPHSRVLLIYEKRHGHKHRCAECCLNNILKALFEDEDKLPDEEYVQ